MLFQCIDIRICKVIFLVVLGLFGTTGSGMAKDFYRIGEDFRSLAMGGTGVTSANNSYTLFYNPAALANIFTGWIDFPMVQVAYSDDAEELYQTMATGLKLDDKEEQLDFMEDNIGKNPYIRVHAGINGVANMDTRGFSLAGNYLYELLIDVEVRNKSAPEIVAYERLDIIQQAGFSYPIGLGKLVLGLGYRQVERQELAFTYDFIDATNEESFPDLQEDGPKATASAFDIGFLYRTSTAAHLIWGGVWRNEIKFKTEGITDIPQQLDLGISMRQDGISFRWILAMDVRDVTRQLGSDDPEAGDKSWNRRIHLGTELGILPINKTGSFFSLRAGYTSGYFTYGAEMALSHILIIGYTRYIEETGEYAGQKPSPRTAGYISIGF